MNNSAPTYITNLFFKRSHIKSYNTVEIVNVSVSSNAGLPWPAQQSFAYRGSRVWDSLPGELQNCTSVHTAQHIKNIERYYTPKYLIRSDIYCIALHCIALHCIALHCISLYCISSATNYTCMCTEESLCACHLPF